MPLTFHKVLKHHHSYESSSTIKKGVVCLKHFHKEAHKIPDKTGHQSGTKCYNCTKIQDYTLKLASTFFPAVYHKVKEVFIKDGQGQSLQKCIVVRMQLNLHSSAVHVFPFIPFGSSAHTVGSKCRFQRK